MNQCVALIIGAKIQNGYKILSIDTYYKGKLAYPHFNNCKKIPKKYPVTRSSKWKPLQTFGNFKNTGSTLGLYFFFYIKRFLSKQDISSDGPLR